MRNARYLRWWILTAALWPVAVIAAAFMWPGPDEQELLQHYFDKPAYEAVAPPVDTSGATGELTVSDAQGSARIFWTQPKAGKVELTIEVPPEDAGEPVKSREE